MNRFITVITLLAALALGVSGATKRVTMKYKPKKEESGTIHHAPMYPSIDALYESCSRHLYPEREEDFDPLTLNPLTL